jgi:hypothetical protein
MTSYEVINRFVKFGMDLGQDGGGFELGPIGLGISIELGWPNWLVGSTFAFGLDFGIVADNTLLGIGVYTTTKKPVNNPTSFSIAPEVFYVQTMTANQIKIGDLNGYANEIMGSVGPVGATIGWDNGMNYNMYTISGFARGIDFGYGTWETNTNVYQIGDVAIWWGNLFK